MNELLLFLCSTYILLLVPNCSCFSFSIGSPQIVSWHHISFNLTFLQTLRDSSEFPNLCLIKFCSMLCYPTLQIETDKSNTSECIQSQHQTLIHVTQTSITKSFHVFSKPLYFTVSKPKPRR